MKNTYLCRSCNSSDRIWETRSGFPLKKYQLPNVDYFKVIRGSFDELALEFGLQKRISKGFLTSEAHNKDANIYLAKVVNRLHKYAKAKDEKNFTKLFKILQHRSKSYRALIMWRIRPTWYKDLTLEGLKRLIVKVDRILKDKNTTFESKRFWIPKADGTLRPITSPNLEWRFASNMQYSFWVIWLKGSNTFPEPCQHGGLPFRGTKSALQDLEKRCLDSKFIYEFDLSKFFDKVSWMSLVKMSERLNVPRELFNWSFNAIVNLDMKMYKGKLLETKSVIKSGLFDLSVFRDMSIYDATLYIARQLNTWNKRNKLNKLETELFSKESLKGFRGKTESQIEQEIAPLITEALMTGHGVPQGFSLSPLLAILCLNRLYYGWEENLVMYMDDGVLFGNSEEEIQIANVEKLIEHDTGSNFNFSKSGWVKRDGIWLKPLKFLGTVYDPWGETFYGATRNGSTIEIPRRKVKDILRAEGIDSNKFNEGNPISTRERLLKGRDGVRTDLFGLLLSYMYNNGITDNSKFRKIFNLKEKKNSICSLIRKEGITMSLANASSYSSSKLITIWSKM